MWPNRARGHHIWTEKHKPLLLRTLCVSLINVCPSMVLTMEVATLWLASFALAYTVFAQQRLPSFWSQEYANGKHHVTTRWFAYFFFPIWIIVLSCQAAAYATFLQGTPDDNYYAFLIVGIVQIALMHCWNWAWTFPVHPWLAAVFAVMIAGAQLTLLILAIIYNTTNDWVYWMISIPLVWTTIAAIWSIYTAARLGGEFHEIQERVAAKDERLYKLLGLLIKMKDTEFDQLIAYFMSSAGFVERPYAPEIPSELRSRAGRSGMVHFS